MRAWQNFRRIGRWVAGLALLLQLTVPIAVAGSLRAHTAGLPCHAPVQSHASSQQAQDDPDSAKPDSGENRTHAHAACPLCTLLAQAGDAGLLLEGDPLPWPSLPARMADAVRPAAPSRGTYFAYQSRAPPGQG